MLSVYYETQINGCAYNLRKITENGQVEEKGVEVHGARWQQECCRVLRSQRNDQGWQARSRGSTALAMEDGARAEGGGSYQGRDAPGITAADAADIISLDAVVATLAAE